MREQPVRWRAVVAAALLDPLHGLDGKVGEGPVELALKQARYVVLHRADRDRRVSLR
jgi:hypothetical protein